MPTTSPGWYDDGRGALRWWDGAQWTEHVQTPDPEPGAGEEPSPTDGEQPAELSPEDGEQPAETIDTLLAPIAPPAPTLDSASTPDAAIPTAETTAETPTEIGADGGYPPSAPPGYPGGFPGGPAPSGAFIAATEPKKSKLWILWVVLGVVLLGIVILVAVLIPVLIGMFGGGSGSSGIGPGDEDAATAAVELYDEAWGTADCEKYEEATTQDFREELQLPDCASFTAASQGFIDSVEDYELTVTSVDLGEGVITVFTSETYLSRVDAQGNPSDEAFPYEDNYAYIVVPSDGGWAINEALDANAE